MNLENYTTEQLHAEIERRYQEERNERAAKIEQMYKEQDSNYCYHCDNCGIDLTPRDVMAYESYYVICPHCENSVS